MKPAKQTDFDSPLEWKFYQHLVAQQKQGLIFFIYHPAPINLVDKARCNLTGEKLTAGYRQ